MSTRNFDTLLPRVLASTPGCPDVTALNHIRDAAVRTCERTMMWRYQPPVFNLMPGVHEYDYPRPLHTDVHVLYGAMLNGSPLQRLTLEQALDAYPAWADLYSGQSGSELWSETPTGAFNAYAFNEAVFNGEASYVLPASIVESASEPRIVTQLTPDKFIVIPLPDEKVYRTRLFLALKPSRDATGMDRVVFDELEDAIFHSALQHLLTLPNQSWMDLELAAYHAKQFLFLSTERRARANLGNVRGTLKVRFNSCLGV